MLVFKKYDFLVNSGTKSYICTTRNILITLKMSIMYNLDNYMSTIVYNLENMTTIVFQICTLTTIYFMVNLGLALTQKLHIVGRDYSIIRQCKHTNTQTSDFKSSNCYQKFELLDQPFLCFTWYLQSVPLFSSVTLQADIPKWCVNSSRYRIYTVCLFTQRGSL